MSINFDNIEFKPFIILVSTGATATYAAVANAATLLFNDSNDCLNKYIFPFDVSKKFSNVPSILSDFDIK